MWIDAAPSEEEAYLPQHAQLHIAGTDNDGPVRIQVLFDFTDNLHYVDMIDFDVGFSKPIGMNAGEGQNSSSMKDDHLSSDQVAYAPLMPSALPKLQTPSSSM